MSISSPLAGLAGAAALIGTALALSPVLAAQAVPCPHDHRSAAPCPMHAAAPFTIPESMRAEHAEIQGALERATRAPGRVGAAARALSAVLHPHFVREEQIALPPLGLLAPLARGEHAAEMRAVLPMTDSLRAELPAMLEEHASIRAATLRLREAARAARNDGVVQLTEKLMNHARGEEEMFYPAAVLVGDLVRLRVPEGAAR